MSEAVPDISRGPRLVASRPLAAGPEEPVSADQKKRMRAPIVAGGITVAVFFLGFVIWAALSHVSGGVPAPGVITVEDNRKTVQHLDGGVIREIRVREGDHVTAGQVLFTFDDSQARAQVDVLTNQYDSLLAQKARLEAELADRTEIVFPVELTSRAGDPRVAGLMRDQETLFRASRGVYLAQSGVLGQRVQQLETRRRGLEAQVSSLDQQNKLVADELSGVNSLYERGFAPKSRVLALQRSQAGLTGDRGARQADIAGVHEAVGETRIQLAQLKEQRATQAADTLRQVQVQMADVLPRLTAAQAVLDRTVVRSPADGYALALTQFTVGGVARPGERLVDVVPDGAPLVVRVSVRPEDIDDVKVGMNAEVRLTAYHSRTIPPVKAKVMTVSADRITNEKGEAFFTAQLVVDPAELKRLPEVKLSPGMPAQAIIVTGERSILDYLTSPIVTTLRDSMRES